MTWAKRKARGATGPELSDSTTSPAQPSRLLSPMLAAVPDAFEAECSSCGWFTLQATRDDALARYALGHDCRGGAS